MRLMISLRSECSLEEWLTLAHSDENVSEQNSQDHIAHRDLFGILAWFQRPTLAVNVSKAVTMYQKRTIIPKVNGHWSQSGRSSLDDKGLSFEPERTKSTAP